MTNIPAQLAAVKQQIAAYEKKYQRLTHSVSLLAVSKTHSVEKVLSAYAAGQRQFGENYVQEALPKIEALSDKQIEWHFIGPIQSNKTRKIAEHFAWVHSVASVKIANRLNEQRPSDLPPLNICIEVNIDAEESKAGINPTAVETLAAQISILPQLKLRGLMCIPAASMDFTQQRLTFRKLYTLYEALQNKGFNLDTLSMGMSDDFEAAIAEGSTLIRLGTAIFGTRA